jgi:hypothetical protein
MITGPAREVNHVDVANRVWSFTLSARRLCLNGSFADRSFERGFTAQLAKYLASLFHQVCRVFNTASLAFFFSLVVTLCRRLQTLRKRNDISGPPSLRHCSPHGYFRINGKRRLVVARRDQVILPIIFI